jgi:hypothetical protein
MPTLWKRVDEMIEAERFFATVEVLHELEAKADDAASWAKARGRMFVPLDEAIQLEVRNVLQLFPRLMMQMKKRNAADPWVIGLAALRDAVVVTGEFGGTDQRPKIPYVCDQLGIKHLTFVAMIQAEGWSF